MTREDRLAELGLELPPASAPGGNYLSSKRVGSLVYLAGVVSIGMTGTVGQDRSVEDGYAAAKACALTQLPASPSNATELPFSAVPFPTKSIKFPCS